MPKGKTSRPDNRDIKKLKKVNPRRGAFAARVAQENRDTAAKTDRTAAADILKAYHERVAEELADKLSKQRVRTELSRLDARMGPPNKRK